MDSKDSTLVEKAFNGLVYEQHIFGNMLGSSKPSSQFFRQWIKVECATKNLRKCLKRYDSNLYLLENDEDG